VDWGSVESAREYPNTAAVAFHLYGSLEEQFAYGLDRLLEALGIARDVSCLPPVILTLVPPMTKVRPP
jgi:hypothetical protein